MILRTVAVFVLLALVPPASSARAVVEPGLAGVYAVALEEWGAAPCRGRLTLRWGRPGELRPFEDGRALWRTGRRSSWDCTAIIAPELRARPSELAWEKFCTVTSHELGHLWGRGHSDDPADLMAPGYGVPTALCARRTVPISR